MKRIFLAFMLFTTPLIQAGPGLINHNNRQWTGPLLCTMSGLVSLSGAHVLARSVAKAYRPEDLFTPQSAIGAASIVSGLALFAYCRNQWTRETGIDILNSINAKYINLNTKYATSLEYADKFKKTIEGKTVSVLKACLLAQQNSTLEIQLSNLPGEISQLSIDKQRLTSCADEIRAYGKASERHNLIDLIDNLQKVLPELKIWSSDVNRLEEATIHYEEAQKTTYEFLTAYQQVLLARPDNLTVALDQFRISMERICFSNNTAFWQNIDLFLTNLFTDLSILQRNIPLTPLGILYTSTISQINELYSKLYDARNFYTSYVALYQAEEYYSKISRLYAESLEAAIFLNNPNRNNLSREQLQEDLLMKLGMKTRTEIAPLIETITNFIAIAKVLEEHLDRISPLVQTQTILSARYMAAQIEIEKLLKLVELIIVSCQNHPSYIEQANLSIKDKNNKIIQGYLQQLEENNREIAALKSSVKEKEKELLNKITTECTKAQNAAVKHANERCNQLDNYIGKVERRVTAAETDVSSISLNVRSLMNKAFQGHRW